LVHPDKSNALTHKVLPVGTRFLQNLFDYGSLSKEDEKTYVNAILNKISQKVDQIINQEDFVLLFSEIVGFSQNFIRTTVMNNESSVSLRDIKRVKKIFLFYCYFISFKQQIGIDQVRKNFGDNYTFTDYLQSYDIDFNRLGNTQVLRALIISININYFNRIVNKSKSSK
jgi:hypothetical protein